jgi:AcrR family transcriptional regulator
MPSPRRRRRMAPVDRREQLLQAALRIAARGGITTVSLADVTAEAGVSVGLLYHYFSTKEDLLAAAVDRAADTLLAALDDGPASEPFDQALALLHAYLQYVQDHPEAWWLGFLREACRAWIEHPDLQRRAVSNALIDSFVVSLEATGWYDGTAKEALGVLHVA